MAPKAKKKDEPEETLTRIAIVNEDRCACGLSAVVKALTSLLLLLHGTCEYTPSPHLAVVTGASPRSVDRNVSIL